MVASIASRIIVAIRMIELFILIILPNDGFSSTEGLQKSRFPRGPFALPMSKDGCPEGPSKGWKTSYINITTTLPVDQPQSFLEKCRGPLDEFQYSHISTAIIGPSNRFSLQMNFCYKSEDHLLNDDTDWAQGFWGLFGTDKECPAGFIAREMSVCLPPLLHYNEDGQIPYIKVVEAFGHTDIHFILCRRMQPGNDTNNQTFNSFNPFAVIKDPEVTECPDVQGYDVSTEIIPIPMPTRILNISENNLEYFQLSFCHFVSKDYKIDRQADLLDDNGSGGGVDDKDSEVPTKYQTDYWQLMTSWFGYPGYGYAFVDVKVFVNRCGDYIIGGPLLNCTEDVEVWIMLDARQAVLVSGIMFTEMNQRYHGHLSKILVADDKWSFLHDGAFVCRHTGPLNWEIYQQVIHRCYRSVFGRYVTLVFRSKSLYWDDVHLKGFYNTLVVVLSYVRDEVKTFESRSEQPQINQWVKDTMAVLNNTELDRRRCNQDMGMRNFDIMDHQLTASSWQQSHDPSAARPHLSGWCAEHSDIKPFVQLDLKFVTTIDGVVIINWFEMVDIKRNNTFDKVAMKRGCYSFDVEYGTSLDNFVRYNKKHFIYDTSRTLGEPQSFLFSDPFLTRYIRLFPSPFPNTETTCMKFEILGCRYAVRYRKISSSIREPTVVSLIDDDIFRYLTETNKYPLYGTDMESKLRLEHTWRLVFNTSVTNITEPGVITSLNYPKTYSYNTIQQWKIQLPGKYAVVQFADISLRTFENTDREIFLNDRACQDVILVSSVNIVDNLMRILSDNLYSVQHFSSIYNGRMPSVFMMREVGYLAFLTCARGNFLAPGRGFRLHITERGYPFCQGIRVSPYCALPTMDLITSSYLGNLDVQSVNQYRSLWVVRPSSRSLVMTLKIEDFDVSCNSESEVSLYMSHISQDTTICNAVRPHGELHYLAGHFNVVYKPYNSNLYSKDVFPEGFQMKYNFLPRETTLPYRLKLTDPLAKSADYNRRVCADDFKKCYDIHTIVSSSWVEVAHRCKETKSLPVNIKSLKELQLVRGLLMDFYYYLRVVKSVYASEINPFDTYVFIGLTRYIDWYGQLHEFWTDGTPLTYTAWDSNQPADIILNQCTTMHVREPGNRNSWKTESCTKKVPGVMLYVCEQNNKNVDQSEKEKVDVRTDAETNILPATHTEFTCGSGEIMSLLAVCDGVSECSDSSDENNCTVRDEGSCREEEFECTDGRCIHVSQVCDFKEDCLDAADEYCDFPRCREKEFTCFNGECVMISNRCDAEVHCSDGSDERNCDECTEGFQCGDRSCISRRLVCDVHVDCPDATDEKDCNLIYTTCEDLWKDGFTESKIYVFGADKRYVSCNFDDLKANNLIRATYLNSQWKQTSLSEYKINTPGIEVALEAGYVCSQKFTELPHRERLKVMELENQEFEVNEWELGLRSTYITTHNQWQISLFKIKRPINETFIVYPELVDPELLLTKYRPFVMTTMDDFKHSEYRIKIGPVECVKDKISMTETLFCRDGVKSVDYSKKCVYGKDSIGVIDGCRSLNHLQNCENFTCPKYHFKCPRSFCIPHKYVCNGRTDCGDGSDEKYCACTNTEKRSIFIIVPYSGESPLLLEMAAQLGGMLFTENSSIKVLRWHKDDDPTYFDAVDIVSISENFAPVFSILGNSSTDVENAILDLIGNSSSMETVGVIWVSLDTSTDAKYDVFKNLDMLDTDKAAKIQKYKITVDRDMKTILSVSLHSKLTNIRVRNHELLRTLGLDLFPGLCKRRNVTCAGRYRCRLSKVCIPFVQVCDGRKQCPFSDDENHNCGFQCPMGCTCRAAAIYCTSDDPLAEYIDVAPKIRILDLSHSRYIGEMFLQSEKNNASLLMLLNVSMCNLAVIDTSSFELLNNLITLDLSYNLFQTLLQGTFSNLKFLKHLYLHGNRKLQILEAGAFAGLRIKSLNIKQANIQMLIKNTFSGLNLTELDISNNQIRSVEDFAFGGLYSESIKLTNNPISEFSKEFFTGVQGVKHIYTSAYKFCCVRPFYVIEENCIPYKDEFSSCEDLMRKTVLRVLLWIIGFLALLGNIMSVVYRIVYDKKRMKLGYGIFVTNLAVADMFMGIYMLIIAVADFVFRDRYIEMDEQWRSSIWCKFAGVLSTTSTEASVLFMCLITIDRILVIKFPFGQHRFNTRSAVVAASVGWIFALILALFPIVHVEYFQDTFYSKSAVCLALPLTRDRPPGWLYSILIFIGFNLITFVLIAAGQLLIYAEVKKHASVQKAMNFSRKRDLKVARNLLLVVTTDFLCWFPVGMMGVLALSGHVISSEVYAWTAVLVLPVNSALNPFLYTLSAIIGKSNFSPSLDEQAKSEGTKDMGKAVLCAFPYIAVRKYNNRLRSLAFLLEDDQLTVNDLLYIFYQIFKFENILHGVELALKKITEKDVLIQVGKTGNIQKKVQILGNPDLYTNKKELADDVYQTGLLLKRALLALGR